MQNFDQRCVQTCQSTFSIAKRLAHSWPNLKHSLPHHLSLRVLWTRGKIMYDEKYALNIFDASHVASMSTITDKIVSIPLHNVSVTHSTQKTLTAIFKKFSIDRRGKFKTFYWLLDEKKTCDFRISLRISSFPEKTSSRISIDRTTDGFSKVKFFNTIRRIRIEKLKPMREIGKTRLNPCLFRSNKRVSENSTFQMCSYIFGTRKQIISTDPLA